MLLGTGAANAPQYYNMILLGFAPFNATSLSVNGIDNNGDVVGFDNAINGAFLYHKGAVSSLGFSSAAGVSVNSHGFVAIRSWGSDLHSYLYTPGRLPWFVPRFTDLGTLGGSGGLNKHWTGARHGDAREPHDYWDKHNHSPYADLACLLLVRRTNPGSRGALVRWVEHGQRDQQSRPDRR